MSERVGVIGLGIMGAPMALNLVKAGFAVTVWNRTPSRCAPVVAAGAAQAAGPADVARRSDVIITVVSDTPDVEAVLFGPGGAAEGLAPGKVVIDMSTISPAATETFAARLAALGCALLDAPVSGGDVGARAGTLAIMVGGETAVLERCRPILEALGKTIVHLGPSGAGQKCKLVNQVLGALHAVAMAEALALAERGGLDPALVQAVVSQGAAGSWALTHLAPRMIAGDHAPGFMVKLQHKDLRLVEEWIDALGMDAPAAALARRMFARAMERGLGELGTQSLARLYARPAREEEGAA